MLQGRLNDFTLADVFSLLSLTSKTGVLTVTAEGTDGRVFFREGAICLALSDARRVPLGARLVSAGLIDAEQVRTTVQEHAGNSVAVTESLLAAETVEDRVISVFLREQIIDAVFELMRLEQGSFSFDTEVAPPSRGPGLSVVEVVGEASRRLDEWQSIHAKIASPHAVVAMVPSAANEQEGVKLTPEQWEMLALIDGRRTVSDVVELTGRGEFATCRVLGDLVTAGLVQAEDPAAGGQTDLARLISAREALRALEDVGRTGVINPRLSSAVNLAAGESQTRWVEPPPAPAVEEPPKQTLMPSRSRVVDPPSGGPEPGDTGDIAPGPAEAAADDVPAVDRAQVARELASLGSDDEEDDNEAGHDSDGKGLLLRVIDGVKGG